GRQYRHGTISGYSGGGGKCEHCRGAYATYRAERRAAGKDQHPPARTQRINRLRGRLAGHSKPGAFTVTARR
ncbi:MAG TPA: hypothetical protein VHY21_23785, partial [Pseudonocardiaceae bacterium]|nr:hypothetical protein [Pseudonocardiaceae bacterium]